MEEMEYYETDKKINKAFYNAQCFCCTNYPKVVFYRWGWSQKPSGICALGSSDKSVQLILQFD